jgi:transposase
LLDHTNPAIEALTPATEQEAKKRLEVLRMMTHSGIGPLTAPAFVLIIGTPQRFRCGKQIGSYVRLIPSEDSSVGHQRLGHSKEGSSLLCYGDGCQITFIVPTLSHIDSTRLERADSFAHKQR